MSKTDNQFNDFEAIPNNERDSTRQTTQLNIFQIAVEKQEFFNDVFGLTELQSGINHDLAIIQVLRTMIGE